MNAWRREAARQPLDHELVEALRFGQILEAIRAEVTESRRGRAVGNELTRSRRHERLATVRCRCDSRAAMHVDADIVAVRDQRLTRMQTHPHPDRRAVGPPMPSERYLCRDRGRERTAWIREGDKEAVPLRVHLDPAIACERLANELPVVCEHAGVVVAELVEEPRRPLDVGEEKCDRTCGQFSHHLHETGKTLPMPGLAAPT